MFCCNCPIKFYFINIIFFLHTIELYVVNISIFLTASSLSLHILFRRIIINYTISNDYAWCLDKNITAVMLPNISYTVDTKYWKQYVYKNYIQFNAFLYKIIFYHMFLVCSMSLHSASLGIVISVKALACHRRWSLRSTSICNRN